MSRTSILAAAACLAMASAVHAEGGGSTTMNQGNGASMSGGASMNADYQTIRQVQQELKAQGYDPGAVDGVLGMRTKAAIKEYQQAQGMSGTGRLDSQTLAGLGVEGGAELDANADRNRSGSSAPSGQDKTTSPSLRPDSSTVGGSASGSAGGDTANRSRSGSTGGSAAGSSGAGTSGPGCEGMNDPSCGSDLGTKNRSGSGAPSGQDKTTSPPLRPDSSTIGR